MGVSAAHILPTHPSNLSPLPLKALGWVDGQTDGWTGVWILGDHG